MATVPDLSRNQSLTGRHREEAARELLARYQAGRSLRGLRAETGYSLGRIRRLLIEAGVEFRRRGGGPRQRSGTAH